MVENIQKLKIIIVNTQSFPPAITGAASVNRILSYAGGLVKQGNTVHVLTTAVGDKEWREYGGVLVRHVGRATNTLINKIINHLGNSYRLIKYLHREKKDVVIFVTSNYFLIILLELYCKLTKTKLVNERSEYPFVIMTKNKLKRILAPLYTNSAYKLLDGMIIMTKPLMDYYQKKASPKCRFLEVPMTVDANRFALCNTSERTNQYGDYIAYCGNMGGNKDGVYNLIKAFSIIEERGYPLSLLLIGGTNNQNDYDELLKLNTSLGNKKVHFYGKADRDSMPYLLKNAKILALARPSSLQSTGGFPTKLGEYLATGNPVVVTAVGDIPIYLHDKQNAFVVEPDNIEAFADAICYVWDHYDEAKLVGQKGQEMTKTVFNGDYQAKRIEVFLKELLG